MLKKNSLIKRFNKLLISIIELIESFFRRLENQLNLKKKKKIGLKEFDFKIPLILGSFVILILSYFLIPTVYDKNLIKTKLKNQIFEKFNLQVKFENEFRYGLFPRPHYFIKDIVILNNKKNLGKSDYSKVYISINNFFSLENLKIKDLVFKKTEFNVDFEDISFFKNILDSNKETTQVKFIDSILFFQNQNKDVIFFTDIKSLKFFYNTDFEQQLSASFKVFNLPFALNLKDSKFNKKAYIDLSSHKIRLNIENDFDYSKENIEGLLNFKVINDSKLFSYQVQKNNLNLNSEDEKFKVNLDFKPFYLLSELNFHQLNLKKIFRDDSILFNLLNSEILNNQNLNAQLNFNFEKIQGVNYFGKIALKTYLEEGNINIKNSKINWNDSVLINLIDSQVLIENSQIIYTGSVVFDFDDIEKFYSHYQIKKSLRKKIKKVKLDFLLNINEKEIQLDNFRVDGVSSKNINDYLNYFNSKKINVFNKVIFRNSIKDFFIKNYNG